MSLFGLFVGVNYPGTSAQLHGCVNDAKDIQKRLEPVLSEYVLLLDKDATAENILTSLEASVNALRAQDVLVFSFSGHGTWIPDTSGDEPDGRDECLCPIDYRRHLIVDDDLDRILSLRKRGSRIVFLADTCHSGTVFRMAGRPTEGHAIKFLPPEEVLQDKPKAIKQSIKMEEKAEAKSVIKKENTSKSGLIHFSGCQDVEYSYDATFNGRPNGAFTRTFLDAFNYQGEWTSPDGGCKVTYDDVYKAVREKLPSYDYPQRPRLNATSADKRRKLFT